MLHLTALLVALTIVLLSTLAGVVAAGSGTDSPTPLASSQRLPTSVGQTVSHWSNSTGSTSDRIGTVPSGLRPMTHHNSASPSSTVTDGRWSNISAIGDCWDQWNAYWTISASRSARTFHMTLVTAKITMEGAQVFYATDHRSYGPSTITTVNIDYGPNHDFPIATETETTTNSGGTDWVYVPTSTGPSYVSTSLQTIWSNAPVTYAKLTTPACALPSIVPQFQSQWDGLAEEMAGSHPNLLLHPPVCQAASVNSRQCSAIIAAAYSGFRVFGNTGIPGWITSATSTWWPTHRRFAPGCKLGCQTCAITGDTVRVLYWPPATTAFAANGTMTARPFSPAGLTPNASLPVTALIDNTTLTSPTIYISYRSLYASNSCNQVGRRYRNTIIPLANNGDLSSLAYHQLDGYARGPAQWGDGVSWQYEEKPFNLSDLVEPIPDSIYNQLPWCQSALSQWSSAGFGPQSFSCLPHVPYAPMIPIPAEVRNVDPDWASCTAWYGGVYDPPKALQGASTVATPTVPGVAVGASASAGSTVDAGLPAETGNPRQPTSTPADSTQPLAVESDAPAPAATTLDGNTLEDSTSTVGGAVSDAATSHYSATAEDPNQPPSTDSVVSSLKPTILVPTITTSGQAGNGVTTSGLDPTTQADSALISQAKSLQATTNALSVLESAYSGASTSADLRSTITSGVEQSPSSDPSVGAGASVSGQLSEDLSDAGTSTIQPVTNALSILESALVSTALAADPTVVSLSSLKQSAGSDPGTDLYLPAVVTVKTVSAGQLSTSGVALSTSSDSSALPLDGPTNAAAPQTTEVVLNNQGSAVVLVGSSTVTAGPVAGQSGVVIINSKTSFVGDTGTATGGQSFSAGADGAVSDASTPTSLPQLVTGAAIGGSGAVLTFRSSTLTAVPLPGATDAVLLGGATLSLGGPDVTIDGQVVSAGDHGIVLAGSTTIALAQVDSQVGSATVVVFGSSTITVSQAGGRKGGVVVDGTTLAIGAPARTIAGEAVSDGSSGLVIGGTTTFAVTGGPNPANSQTLPSTPGVPLASPTTTTSDGSRTGASQACWIGVWVLIWVVICHVGYWIAI